MRWGDKVEVWKASEVTKAYRENLMGAIAELQNAMPYEENMDKLRIMQGMMRAYLDMLDVLDEGLAQENSEGE